MAQRTPIPMLHLITELSTGGAQSVLLRQLERTDRTAFAPVVACYYNGDTPIATAIRALGIEVIDLGMAGKASSVAMMRLLTLLHARRPTILHTWMFHANVPGRVLGRLAGVPIIVAAEHTMRQESAIRRRLNRVTAPLADRIICVSQSVRNYAIDIIGLPPEKLVVIPNGVDLRRFSPKGPLHPETPVHFACVGRLEPIKGADLLLEAAALLRSAWPDQQSHWSLTFVGDGSQRTQLETRAAALGLNDCVRFLGTRQDVGELLPSFDAVVMPSRSEGMPMVALEAMACGLPVVATAVGGTPEVVVHSETGILTSRENPIALAQAMAVLLADPSLRKAMGASGRRRVEAGFSVDASVAQTETLYRQLLDAHSMY